MAVMHKCSHEIYHGELYREMQGLPQAEWEQYNAKWRRACDAYGAAFAKINLDSGHMEIFAEKTFHDRRSSRRISRPTDSELVLDIDATGNPWGPIGVFRIKFRGVREFEGIGNLVGDEWLYEEVHLHPVGGFDYRVLSGDRFPDRC